MPKTSLTCSCFANILSRMRVISKKRLDDYGRQNAQAKTPLDRWYNHVKSKTEDWVIIDDVRKDYRTADQVGDCFVFDIGGNNYRLIVKTIGNRVYVMKIITHAQYSTDRWKNECNCFKPLRRDSAKKVSKKATKTRKKK